MKRLLYMGCAALLTTTGWGCASDAPSDGSVEEGQRVSIDVAALELGQVCQMTVVISNSYMDIVTNTPITNWSTAPLDIGVSGQTQWIGPCVVEQDVNNDGTPDAGALASQNTVHITIGTYTVPGPDGACGTADDLVPADAPQDQSSTYTCVENSDTPQNFEILMVKRAYQGFTDVTFDYDEVFCSCKLDCLDAFLPDETPTSFSYNSDGTCSLAASCQSDTDCDGATCDLTTNTCPFVTCATDDDCPIDGTCDGATIDETIHTQYDRAPTIAFAAACTGGGDVGAADGYCEGACAADGNGDLFCPDASTCTSDSDCGQCGSNQACIGIGTEQCKGVTITHDVETAMGLHGGMVCCCNDYETITATPYGEILGSVAPDSTTFDGLADDALNAGGSIDAGTLFITFSFGPRQIGFGIVSDDGQGGIAGTGVTGTVDYDTGAIHLESTDPQVDLPAGPVSASYTSTAITAGPDGHCDNDDQGQPTQSCVSYNSSSGLWEDPNDAPWFGNAEEYDGEETIENKDYNNHAISFDLDWLETHSDGTWSCRVMAQAEVDWTEDGVTDPEDLQPDYANGDFSLYWDYGFTIKEAPLSSSCGADVRDACQATFKDVFIRKDTNDGKDDNGDDDTDETIGVGTPAVNVQTIRDERKDQSMTLNKVHPQADGTSWTNISNVYSFTPLAGVSSQDLSTFAFNAQLFAEFYDTTAIPPGWAAIDFNNLSFYTTVSLHTFDTIQASFVPEANCDPVAAGTAENSAVLHCDGLTYVDGTRYIAIKSALVGKGGAMPAVRYRFAFATSNDGEQIYPSAGQTESGVEAGEQGQGGSSSKNQNGG